MCWSPGLNNFPSPWLGPASFHYADLTFTSQTCWHWEDTMKTFSHIQVSNSIWLPWRGTAITSPSVGPCTYFSGCLGALEYWRSWTVSGEPQRFFYSKLPRLNTIISKQSRKINQIPNGILKPESVIMSQASMSYNLWHILSMHVGHLFLAVFLLFYF